MIKRMFFRLIILSCFCFGMSNSACKNINEPLAANPEDESLERLKELADFSHWPGKNGPVRDGVNLSKCTIPSLSATIEVPQKLPFSLQYTDEEKLLIRYRSCWQKSSENTINITLIFAETCDEIHNYTIKRFFYSSLPFEARVPRKDEPPVAGDISFSRGRRFIRNNIFVEIYADGELIQSIATVAKDIDNLLLTRSTASSADQFKPIIKRFEIMNSLVEYNSQTKLLIDAVDPKGSSLYYFWQLTGGGTDKDESGNWYYYALADPGSTQTITLIVVNDRGYYRSSSIKVKIIP